MKYCLQIATILSTLTVATLAAAQDDVAPRAVVAPPEPARDQPPEAPPPPSPPPAVGGEGRWVIDLLGASLGSGPVTGLGALYPGGTIAFVGPVTVSSGSTETDSAGSHMTYKSTSFALTPSVDVFVTEHLSIGGRVGAGIFSSSTVERPEPTAIPNRSSRGTTLGIAPRIGYAVPLSSSFAFWPRLGVGYAVSHLSVTGPDADVVTRSYFVESTLGLGVRVSKHAFFDVGPVLTYRRSTSDAPNGISSVYGLALPAESHAFDAGVRASLRLDF